jgi:DNA-binding beta-propeller fold protein YncE
MSVAIGLVVLGVVLARGPAIAPPPGRIYVADRENNRIVRMNDMTGAGWTTFGAEGSGTNQFNDPFSIFVDGAGRIYVTDNRNNRIVRMNDMTGAGWTTFGTAGSGTNQFRRSVGIFVR